MDFKIDSLLKAELKKYCSSKGIDEVYIFGSYSHASATKESDLDILVNFEFNKNPSIYSFLEIEEDLSRLLNKKVELVTKNSILNSPNKYLKESILREAIQII